ncbi:MAG: (2Fe-2S)-binding protein, partial [Planctomycetes bacterium]|nr:(2Fe-2S)-binding protein [Planctomycetota bacterium]
MKNITINGEERSLEGVNPATPLLWVLRDHFGLTGTHYGCGRALCGACTVHVDGKSQRSCQLPISMVGGAKVTTIEGLSPDGGHALQKAWRDLNVPQCGYCQSGQLMQAAHLLAENPKPSDADIDNAMGGNICRCGTYPRIRAPSHPPSRRGDATMIDPKTMGATRRSFLQGVLAGGGFLLATRLTTLDVLAAQEIEGAAWELDLFLRIDDQGLVTILASRSEMGTGIRTVLPLVVAEELDAD